MGLLNKKNIKNLENGWPNPYHIKRKETLGTEFETYPIEVITLILYYYKILRDPHAEFENLKNSSLQSAFTWDNTKEGWDFWHDISNEKFDVFYKKYDYHTLREILRH